MSVTMAQIRTALAANLDAIPSVQASPYMLANPTPPTVWVVPDETDYDEAMQGGLDVVKVTIQAFAGLVADQAAQKLLDEMLDPTGSSSVKATVEADKTLGGMVQDLRVTRHHGYQVYQRPNLGSGTSTGQVIGSEWTVEIYV
jgi:hypothetical protein